MWSTQKLVSSIRTTRQADLASRCGCRYSDDKARSRLPHRRRAWHGLLRWRGYKDPDRRARRGRLDHRRQGNKYLFLHGRNLDPGRHLHAWPRQGRRHAPRSPKQRFSAATAEGLGARLRKPSSRTKTAAHDTLPRPLAQRLIDSEGNPAARSRVAGSGAGNPFSRRLTERYGIEIATVATSAGHAA